MKRARLEGDEVEVIADILVLDVSNRRNILWLIVLQTIGIDIIFIVPLFVAGKHLVVIILVVITIFFSLFSGRGSSSSSAGSFNVGKLAALPLTDAVLIKVGTFLYVSLFTVLTFVTVALGCKVATDWGGGVDADVSVETLIVGASSLEKETTGRDAMGVGLVGKIAGVALVAFVLHEEWANCYLGRIVRIRAGVSVLAFT